MNEWLARASRWQLGLVLGLGCGLTVGIMIGLLDGWAGALVAGVAAGLGGAILGATLVHGGIRRQVEAVGVLSGSTRRAVGRASLWGPVPEDPETRAAAAALAEHALAERKRRPVFGALGGLIMLAMLVRLAILASPWWWIGVAVLLGLTLVGWFVLPRRLRRRIELLRAGPADD